MEMAEQTVYVVDDDEGVCSALGFFFQAVGVEVETFRSAKAFLAQDLERLSGCLVLDIRIPDMSGLDLIEHLVQHDCDIPVIVMTGHGDVETVVRAMKAGVVEFFEKPFDNQQLLTCVRRCMAANEESRQQRLRQREAQQQLARLTPREREIMEMLVVGKINKVIAAELKISVRTVEVHRSRVMEKLQVATLSDIVRIALTARGDSPLG